MQKIILKDIELYAYHGCLEEEAKIGSDYTINVEVECDLTVSSKTDQLKDTVDYVWIYEVVKKQMAIRSELLEHVVDRILNHLKEDTRLTTAEVSVTKINPPIGGKAQGVTVCMKRTFQ